MRKIIINIEGRSYEVTEPEGRLVSRKTRLPICLREGACSGVVYNDYYVLCGGYAEDVLNADELLKRCQDDLSSRGVSFGR